MKRSASASAVAMCKVRMWGARGWKNRCVFSTQMLCCAPAAPPADTPAGPTESAAPAAAPGAPAEALSAAGVCVAAVAVAAESLNPAGCSTTNCAMVPTRCRASTRCGDARSSGNSAAWQLSCRRSEEALVSMADALQQGHEVRRSVAAVLQAASRRRQRPQFVYG